MPELARTEAARERRLVTELFEQRCRALAAVLALAVLGAALFVLVVGWVFGNGAATRLNEELPAMVPSTGLLFMLAGLALLTDFASRPDRALRIRLAICASIAVTAVANIVIGSILNQTGIDDALMPWHPGFEDAKMSLGTSLCFVMAACSLSRLGDRAKRDLRFTACATGGLLLSLLAIIAFCFDVQALYAVTIFANMALHTALCFAAVFGALLLLRPMRGWLGVLGGRGSGSTAARHMLPVMLVAPLVMCLAVNAAIRTGLFDYSFGLSLLAMGMIVTLASTSLLDAQRINRLQEALFDQIRKKAQQRAMARAGQASEDNFREFAEALPVAVYQTDAQGRLIYANRQMQDMTGLPLQDLVGRELTSVLVSCDDDCGQPGNSRADNLSEGSRLCIGGKTIWAINETRPFQRLQDGKPGLVGALLDVSDNREAMQELRTARDAAQEAAHAKTSFLANMSHEIRTPMNGVMGFAELLLESDIDPQHRQYAQLIHDSGESLVRILNDILDLTKIDAGKLVLREEEFDIGGAITNTAQLMRGAASHKKIGLAVSLDPELPDRVIGDELRFGQIVSNLVGNAIKFSDRGEVRIHADASERLGTPWLQVTVADEGIGIDPDRLDTLFEEFVQADSGRTRQAGGTGLGLPIARRLAEAMGGRLSLRSRLGEGTTAVLEIPLVLAVGKPVVARRKVA